MVKQVAPADIAKLKAAVDGALVRSRRPPTPDATEWPFTLPHQHLSSREWALVWDCVRYVRRIHPDVYRGFLRQKGIGVAVVDFLARAGNDVQIADVIEDLRVRSAEADWLVEIPLTNLTLPSETVPLGPGAILVRTDWKRRSGPRDGPYLKDIWAISRHLGDEMTPRNRWLMSSPARPVDVDTRRMASLLLVVRGTEEIALSAAQTRAHLIVAMWCLLSPPRSAYDPSPLWPGIGIFVPAGDTEFEIRRKLYEPQSGFSRARVRGSSAWMHSCYALTRSRAYLEAPLAAMEQAQRGNQCALALLSTARSLYLAARTANELDRTERILFVWRAKEALTHRGRTGQGRPDDRWRTLVARLRIRRDLVRRGYDPDEIDEAFRLAESWRDLTTHLADDVLINLDYPSALKTHLHGGRVMGIDEASLAVVASDWPIILNAVQVAARRLTKGAIKRNWCERWFNSRFE